MTTFLTILSIYVLLGLLGNIIYLIGDKVFNDQPMFENITWKDILVSILGGVVVLIIILFITFHYYKSWKERKEKQKELHKESNIKISASNPFIILCLLSLNTFGLTSGPNNPSTTGVNSGVGSVNWNNDNNVMSSDNGYTITNDLSNGDISYYVVATNFGFVIPSTSNILGVVVEIEKSDNSGSGNVKDNDVKLVVNGNISGSDKSLGGNWGNADATTTYGGSTDLWGNTLTYSEVNSNNFGVAISVKKSGAGVNKARIDNIKITIYYESTLPINLAYFNISKFDGDNNILLNWATHSEVNNDRFDIERSHDGITFEKLTSIGGHGTTSSGNIYMFIDYTAPFGINYYRLKQVDFDGKYKYYGLVSMQVSPNNNLTIIVYPNPSKNDVTIKINGDISTLYPSQDQLPIVNVYTISGQLIKKFVYSSSGDEITIKDLNNGIYVIDVMYKNYSYLQRVVIDRE